MTKSWTVVDEYNKRLGVIMEQYRKDLKATDAKQDAAMEELTNWFDEHYDGEHDVLWPKEIG